MFYSELGINYQYHREALHPDGTVYPSYFWLPGQNLWITIKGSIEDGEVIDVSRFEDEVYLLSRLEGEEILTFFGSIPAKGDDGWYLDYGRDADLSGMSVVLLADGDGGMSENHHWCECSQCGNLDVIWAGTSGRMMCCETYIKERTWDAPRLLAAYDVARAMKFETGWVYMHKAGPYYKIGRTKNLNTRTKQIRLALPYDVENVHVIQTSNPVATERYWHNRFADKRANGEWFLLTDAEVAEFKSKTQM